MIPVWTTREPPLRPGAALAVGEVGPRLIRRLLELSDDALARLEGVHGDAVVVVLGEVPWVDGLQWLGRDPRAPRLWLPTNRTPDVPLDLLQAAWLRRAPEGSAPLVLTPELVVPLGAARPLSRGLLARLP